jgi:hypothetical protein
MKKILLVLTALVLSQLAMAQQFSLPIMPEKMWPSDYAKYETDVLNCCNYRRPGIQPTQARRVHIVPNPLARRHPASATGCRP